jgi:hypothetical protein
MFLTAQTKKVQLYRSFFRSLEYQTPYFKAFIKKYRKQPTTYYKNR